MDQNSTLFRNLCFLHLQRLTLELKCPLCLKLLKNPVVFPCNHIFCNECIVLSKQNRQKCPTCDVQCIDQEIRSAPYMESIVRLCQSLEETVNTKSCQPPSAGKLSELTPSCINMHCNSRKEHPSEILQKRIYADTQLHDSVNNTKGETDSMKLRTAVCDEVERNPDCVIITDGEDVTSMMKKEIQKEECKGSSSKSSNSETDSKTLRQAPDSVIFIIGDEDEDTTIKEELQAEDCKVAGGNSKFPDREGQVLRNASDKQGVDNELGVTKADSHNMPAVHPETTYTWSKKRKRWDFTAKPRVPESDSPSKQGVHCSDIIEESGRNVKSTKHRLARHSIPSSKTASMNRSGCVFCHSSEQNQGTGRLIGFVDKKEIDLTSVSNFDRSKVLIAHEKCVNWAPQIFFENGDIQNLESEVARANKLKCSSCGKKGAGLGCNVETCQKTYHVPCAYFTPEIRWDCENFLMLCPSHISSNFPREESESEWSNGEIHPLPSKITSESEQSYLRDIMPDGKNGLVLIGSALSAEEKTQVENFATNYGAIVSNSWNRDTTHVIASTDATGACIRTFEFLMAILNGKWIVRMDWINACIEANHLVDESGYEIDQDNHHFRNGPKLGRLNFSENGLKLFAGFRFYFFGDFEPGELNELLELVEAAGGITESEEGMMASQEGAAPNSRYLVYNCDPPQGNPIWDTSFLQNRLKEAVDLAVDIGAGILRHKWILDSIAGCKLVPFL